MKLAALALISALMFTVNTESQARTCNNNTQTVKGVRYLLVYAWNGRRCRMTSRTAITATPAPVAPPHDEYTHSRILAPINAQKAYDRGWTGRGSTVLIMDTGVHAAHPDLQGQIRYTQDFTGLGIQDTSGHGTHVAGIVAARRDGQGVHGVAPGSALAIAKIGAGPRINIGAASSAMAWASQYPDVVVANLSANVSYTADYHTAMRTMAPGVFVNSHRHYGGDRYYNLETPESIRIPENMVLVVSAGNDARGYVQNPATFAAATDAQGQLIHGGRMIIAGAWNPAFNRIESAQSGHVCKDFRAGTCQDRYRTSDFYILAPGTAISTWNTGEYKTSGGSSQAAPVVAGALAIIHEMWPYMTPENQARLLLATARRDIPGYSPHTHGQGLLDLDRATQPVGALAIPTTGRNAVIPVGSITVPGIQGIASSVVSFDDYGRHFMLDIGRMIQRQSLRDQRSIQTLTTSGSWLNTWLPNNQSLTINSAMFDHRPSTNSWTLTMNQGLENPWLQFGGAWGRQINTTNVEYLHRYEPSDSGLFAQVGMIHSRMHMEPGLVTAVSPITAVHTQIGWRRGDTVLWGGYQPTVLSGRVQVSMPVAVDAQGRARFHSQDISLREQPRAFVGFDHRHVVSRNQQWYLQAKASDSDQSAHITFQLSW